MSKKCYSCPEMIDDLSKASMFLEGKTKRFQCEDCMDGANCFTCEFCGDGLATQQVDYPSGYREWWCISCTEDYDYASLKTGNEWLFKEEVSK
jgi:hypothetical protein